MKTLSIILISALVFHQLEGAAFQRSHGERIVGGDVARAGQFRFAAAVRVQTSDSMFFCGGALTGTQHIVTAGHCVYNAEVFTVQLGSTHLEGDDENRQTVAASEYYLHPDFNPDAIDNDIAIIKLRMPLELTTYIQPVYTSSVDYGGSTQAIAIGFGQISDSEAGLSNELMYATVTTIPNAECQLTYGSQITDNHVCIVGNYNEGTCTGDNGGPLVISTDRNNYLQIGVASFISGNGCESTDPSGFTRVYPYRDWIHNITGRYDN